MLTYTIGRQIYSGQDRISSGHFSHSQNIPVVAGADAQESLQALLPILTLGAGLALAIIAAVYYFRKEE